MYDIDHIVMEMANEMVLTEFANIVLYDGSFLDNLEAKPENEQEFISEVNRAGRRLKRFAAPDPEEKHVAKNMKSSNQNKSLSGRSYRFCLKMKYSQALAELYKDDYVGREYEKSGINFIAAKYGIPLNSSRSTELYKKLKRDPGYVCMRVVADGVLGYVFVYPSYAIRKPGEKYSII